MATVSSVGFGWRKTITDKTFSALSDCPFLVFRQEEQAFIGDYFGLFPLVFQGLSSPASIQEHLR